MKNLLRYLAFVLMVGGVLAQNNLPACQGSDATNWTNCHGTYFFLADNQWKGDKYVGEFKDGKFHGQGIYYYLAENQFKGNRYVGEFKDGSFNGQGTAFYVNGDKFVGEYKNGFRNGQGTRFILADNQLKGHKLIGEYKNDKLNGQTIYYLANGDVKREWTGVYSDGKLVRVENIDPSIFTRISPAQTAQQPVQQATAPNIEIERLRAEAEEAKRKQGELETQLRITQQSNTQQSSPTNISQKNSKRIALVIGNANYASAPLKNPLNDAADISASLKQSGFEVIDQRNATLQEMTRGIREFGDKLLKSDVGLVYYSGHGLEVKGRNYLLPVNASMIREDEIAFQAIDANLILEKMNTAKKSVNILIVDACRDNPFARSFRSTNRGLAQMDAPTGTIVSFSTSPGKTASDGDGRNSPFTKNLVKAMMRADMPIEAMFKEVRKSVVEETKGQQTPWESSSLIGDFYFKVSK